MRAHCLDFVKLFVSAAASEPGGLGSDPEFVKTINTVLSFVCTESDGFLLPLPPVGCEREEWQRLFTTAARNVIDNLHVVGGTRPLTLVNGTMAVRGVFAGFARIFTSVAIPHKAGNDAFAEERAKLVEFGELLKTCKRLAFPPPAPFGLAYMPTGSDQVVAAAAAAAVVTPPPIASSLLNTGGGRTSSSVVATTFSNPVALATLKPTRRLLVTDVVNKVINEHPSLAFTLGFYEPGRDTWDLFAPAQDKYVGLPKITSELGLAAALISRTEFMLEQVPHEATFGVLASLNVYNMKLLASLVPGPGSAGKGLLASLQAVQAFDQKIFQLVLVDPRLFDFRDVFPMEYVLDANNQYPGPSNTAASGRASRPVGNVFGRLSGNPGEPCPGFQSKGCCDTAGCPCIHMCSFCINKPKPGVGDHNPAHYDHVCKSSHGKFPSGGGGGGGGGGFTKRSAEGSRDAKDSGKAPGKKKRRSNSTGLLPSAVADAGLPPGAARPVAIAGLPNGAAATVVHAGQPKGAAATAAGLPPGAAIASAVMETPPSPIDYTSHAQLHIGREPEPSAAAPRSIMRQAPIHDRHLHQRLEAPSSAPLISALPQGIAPAPITLNIDSWVELSNNALAWLAARPGGTYDTFTYPIWRAHVENILAGVARGFQAVPPSSRPAPYAVEAYKLTEIERSVVQEDVKKELEAGRIFNIKMPRWRSPIFVKDESKGGTVKYRILRDYSVKRSVLQGQIKASINSSIELGEFKMQTFYDAVRKLKRGAWMSKSDIKKAFCSVPLSDDQWELLAFVAGPGGDTYADTRLPFGLAKSPEIFCRLTDLVRLIMASMGYEDIVSYVDDFWLTASDEAKCNAALDALNALLRKLGFQVEESKVEKATKSITFLGLGLSTDARHDGSGVMEAYVPAAKLTDIVDLASALRQPHHRYEVSKLQSLLGKMAFVSRVVHGARAHTMSLLALLNAANAVGSYTFVMDPDGAADIDFWVKFSRSFNGVVLLLEEPDLDPRFLSTDASDTGFGVFFHGQGLWAEFNPTSLEAAATHHAKLFAPPDRVSEIRGHLLGLREVWPGAATAINIKELFAFVWAATVFGHRWRGRRITLHVDNAAALAWINNGSTRSANPFAARMLRRLFWLSASLDFIVKAVYINTKHNVLADILSRSGGRGGAYKAALRDWESHFGSRGCGITPAALAEYLAQLASEIPLENGVRPSDHT